MHLYLQISMFYDQDVENPKTIFELALKLQNFLAEDPVDGDLAMQEYLHPVISTSALIWYDGPKANDKIDVGSKKNGLSKVRFLQKYQGKKYSIAEIHKQEWAVSFEY